VAFGTVHVVKAYSCVRSGSGYSQICAGSLPWRAVDRRATAQGGRHGVSARHRRGWSSPGGRRLCTGVAARWLGTTTATATLDYRRAKAIIQSLVSVALGPVSAVPVLAATSRPREDPCGGARGHDGLHERVDGVAVVELVAVNQGFGCRSRRGSPASPGSGTSHAGS